MTSRRAALLALAAALAAPPALARPFARGRLFRIERARTPPSYVFGTLHTNDPRVTDVPARVVDALADCRTAAFEALFADGDVRAFLEAARDGDGRRLLDDLDASAYARLRAALGPRVPDAATLDETKPWALLLMLAQPQVDGPPSLDARLQALARDRRLAVIGLELPDEQVASLDAVPRASQIALLRWALETAEARAAELEATTRAWLAGDLERLRELALSPPSAGPRLTAHFAALYRSLIIGRNALMAHRLHLPLAHGRVFVAVGALHLGGRQGLLALVAGQGHRISRVL